MLQVFDDCVLPYLCKYGSTAQPPDHCSPRRALLFIDAFVGQSVFSKLVREPVGGFAELVRCVLCCISVDPRSIAILYVRLGSQQLNSAYMLHAPLPRQFQVAVSKSWLACARLMEGVAAVMPSSPCPCIPPIIWACFVADAAGSDFGDPRGDSDRGATVPAGTKRSSSRYATAYCSDKKKVAAPLHSK